MNYKIKTRCFSVVELLVVAAFFLLLTSLLTPALQKTIQHTLLIACKNNLKSVYTTVSIYSQDFDGFCPGPTWDGQVARIYDQKNQIAEYIAPYANVLTTENGDQFTSEMVCPSNKEITTSRTFYNRQNFITFEISGFGRPFGRPDTARVPEDPKVFEHIPDPSQNILLLEVDYNNYPYPSKYALPRSPVHFQNTRNILFFDGRLDQELYP